MSELIESLKELLPVSGIGIVLAYLTLRFAKYLNETLHEDMRLRVSLWFLGDAPTFAWQSHILTFFDSFFGDKYFSRICLARVMFIWGLVFTLYLFLPKVIIDKPLIYRIAGPIVAPMIFEREQHYSLYEHLYRFLIGIVPLSLSLSFDYLTVMKSRFLLEIIRKYSQSMFGSILLLIVDILTCPVTLAIMVFKFYPSSYLITGIALFYPSTIHTIWLGIYFLATLMAGTLTWFSTRLPLLGKILSQKRIEEAPLTLIGEFAAAIVLTMFLAIGLVMPSAHYDRTKVEAPVSTDAEAEKAK